MTRFWNDDTATVISAELIFIMSIVTLGMIVGLTTYRDQLVFEYADLGAAIGAINQSYSFSAITGMNYSLAGSTFVDNPNFCDPQCVAIVDAGASG